MILGLNNLIEEAIKNEVMPGANYCLIANNEKHFGSFGNKALYPNIEKNNIDTIYDMASLSKVVSTTTAIMILLEQGKLRLSDSVSNILPRFKHKNITVWDLLTHTSGLQPDIRGTLYADIRREASKFKEVLIDHIYSLELDTPKNTKIIYSDMGFILLGFIIEEISKKSLDEFCYEHILKPLEMVDSGYNPKDVNRCAPTEDRGKYIDRGYVHDEKAHTLEGVAGHAGLFSTVKDVSNFMEMILNDGLFKGKRILSKKSIDLLFTPQVEETNGIATIKSKRSLGWIVKGDYPVSGDLASEATIMHTGFTGTHMFIDRVNKVAFCMLTNRVHPTRDNTKIIAFRGRLGNYIMSNL
ncbi:MAG: serine hydrolase domain-containing protein [Bacilli bacterium]